MNIRILTLEVAAIALWLTTATEARAAVVWDYSPDATGAGITEDYFGPFYNLASLQYFAEIVRFENPVTLTGMDIYDPVNMEGPMPDAVRIRLWSGTADGPGANLTEFQAAVSTVDSEGTVSLAGFQRVHAAFAAPVSLAAGTDYWVSMSGDDDALGQLTLNQNAPGDSSVFVFDTRNNLALLTGSHVGDMAFRLHGVTAVPLPGAALLMCSGRMAMAGMQHAKPRTRSRKWVASTN